MTDLPRVAARSRRALLAVALLLLFALLGAAAYLALRQTAPAPASAATSPPPVAAQFVGRALCAGCHASQDAAWKGSDHDLAMQAADEHSVLGDFANAKFSYAGTTSTFFRRDGKYFVNTDGPDGKLARLRDQVHLRRPPAAAVPDRVSRRPHAGARHRLGFAAEGQGRPALVPPLSRPERQGRRSVCTGPRPGRTGISMCAECHSTNLRKNFDASTDTFHTTWSEIDVVVRGLPRSRLEPRRVGEEGRRLEGAGRDQGPRSRARRAQGRDVDAGGRHREREAQRAQEDFARDRHVRALPRPREPPLRRLRVRPVAAATRTGLPGSTTASTGTTARCATRSTTGARSCRAGCTRPASPAPTVTTRIRSSSARPATRYARNATHRPGSTRRRTRITRKALRVPAAPRATCRRRRTWSSTRATTIRCGFRAPTSR